VQTLTLTSTDPAAKLARRAFPEYRGRLFRLQITDTAVNCASFWDGGSRDYFAFVHLATGQVTATVPAQSAFDPQVKGLDTVTLPDGVAAVRHAIVCGRDRGLTLIVHPRNVAPLLPAAK